MASVIKFWCFPTEEEEFFNFLKRTGEIIAVPYRELEEEECIPVALDDLTKERNCGSILFGLQSQLNNLKLKSYTGLEGTKLSFSYIDSPLIGYNRGRLKDSHTLSSCNLFAEWKYLSDEKKIVSKPEDFVKWGKKVFRWVREFTPERHQYKSYRVTSKVAEAVKLDSFRLVDY